MKVSRKALNNYNRDNLKGKRFIYINSTPKEMININLDKLLLCYFKNSSEYFVILEDSISVNVKNKIEEFKISDILKVGFKIFEKNPVMSNSLEIQFFTKNNTVTFNLFNEDYPYWVKVFKSVLRGKEVDFFLDTGNGK